MITGHKELISWAGEDGIEGEGVSNAVYWSQAWDSNKAAHSQVANSIFCFQYIYLKKKCPTSAVCAFPSHMGIGVP